MPDTGQIPCTRCARANDPWRKYCGGCSSALLPVCRHCGFGNRPADRYCGGCASALASPTHPRTRPPNPPPGKSDVLKSSTIQIDIVLDDVQVSSTTSELPRIPDPPASTQ